MSGTSADPGEEQGSGATSLAYLKASKRYPGSDSDAVHELELEVPAGEICVLVGPSGCGKTTAMRMANRTVEITSGDIEIGGRSVLDRNPSDLRREIGYVIQQIGLFPHRTVSQNIATVPRLLDWDEDRIEARVAELLALIGLDPDYGDRYPAQLSGGQQQRIGVARALAVDPPLMLMDEPFGAIDPINRTRLQDEFLRLQERIGKTVLFVTHDVDEAIKMGDRIAVLREGGRLAQYSPPAELLARPADDFVRDFVGTDRALKRLALIPVSEVELAEPVTVRAGESPIEVMPRIAAVSSPHPLLIDGGGRPLGWLDPGRLETGPVPESAPRPPEPMIDVGSTLRDALSALLQAGVGQAPVIDGDGRLVGIISVGAISDFLSAGEDIDLELPAAARPRG
ncbi:MAG: ATP-binding cassette domain-containing protein [Solirubrobacterales bacterium]